VLNSERNHSQGKQHYRTLFALAVVLLIGLGMVVFWLLTGIRSGLESRLSNSLETVLSTTDKAIQTWVNAEEQDVTVVASNDDLRLNVEKQLQIGRDLQRLRTSAPLKRIRNLLGPAMKIYRLVGFAIIAPDGVQIAAHLDDAIGTTDIVGQNPDLLARAMAGTTNLGLPFSTSFLDPSVSVQKQYPWMTFTAPIRDEAGIVIAALAFRADPQLDFTEATYVARLETSGETYAFDRQGRLLTESRFDDQLRKAGILTSDAASILNVEIRDPGGNIVEGYQSNTPPQKQPLTRMAQSAVEGNSGIDIHGYRDYRGVPVIGAWLWDSQLKMGLTTEMDLSEAFAPYRHFREPLLFLLLVTLAVSTGLLLILRHRDRLLASRERLLVSNDAYRQAMNARDDMMAIVAHDLKHPLNSLLLRSQVMLLQVAEGAGSETIKHSLEQQQRTARQMNQLIGDLTDAAKIRAGRLYLERQECTLQQAVEPATERMQLLSQEKGVEFTAHVPKDVLRLSVDQPRITQVLDNLLGNALKFTPPGGKITVHVKILENEAQVSVADTGPGIHNEALSRVFDPYWQGQKTRTGMGLGLFIAKKIIESHGGRIWVESSVGRGTTFYFTLPSTGKQDKLPDVA
jgi:signal transduction histidine kinase